MAAEGERIEVVAEGAIVSFRKPRALTAKGIIKGIGGRTIDECMEEAEARKQQNQAELAEATVMGKAQEMQATEARSEFDQAHADVAQEIELEIAAALKLREMKTEKRALEAKTNTLRGDVFEAQKKVAMLEIMEVNRAKAKAINDQYAAAAKAAEEANKNYLEEKKLQKQRLAAAFGNLDKKGAKRTARAIACDAEEDEPASKLNKVGETEKVEESMSKRPMVEGKPIPSPATSQCSPKHSAMELDEYAPTIVQSTSALEREATTCTLLDDAQLPGSP